MKAPETIDAILAVITLDEDGNEIVPYIIDKKDGGAIPLVTAAGDAVRVEMLKKQAKWFASTQKRPTKLVQFGARHVLETYRP